MGVHLREKNLSDGSISFYLDIYHNKQRWYEFLDIHISKGKLSEADKEKKLYAQQIKIKRENELIVQDNGLIHKGKQKADFVKWYQQYATKEKAYNHQFRLSYQHVSDFQDGKPLPFQTLTPEWIVAFIGYLKPKLHNNSVRHYLKCLNRALKDAVKADMMRKNPMDSVDRKNLVKKLDTFRKAFTIEELQILISTPCNIPEQIKQAYLFSCFCGLRWSDVNPLRWSQIVVKRINGEQNYFIHFQQEKTEEIEYFPLSDQAVNILKRRKVEQQQEPDQEQGMYVFPDVKDNRSKNAKNASVNYYLKKWAKAAGLDPKLIHFHTSRHTFATNVLEHASDGDLWTVSKLLGHKSIQATQIYAKIRDKRKMAAVKALPTLNLPELNTGFNKAS